MKIKTIVAAIIPALTWTFAFIAFMTLFAVALSGDLSPTYVCRVDATHFGCKEVQAKAITEFKAWWNK